MKNEESLCKKKFIELEWSKNYKEEIVFKNLDNIKENDTLILDCKNHFDCIFDFPIEKQGINNDVVIKNIQFTKNNISFILSKLVHIFNNKIYLFHVENFFENAIKINEAYKKQFINILPKWDFPENSTVLFLTDKDRMEYINNQANIYCRSFSFYQKNKNDRVLNKKKNCNHISIMLSEIHKKDKTCPYHTDNVYKICKELKEKYKVKKIELFISRWFEGYNYDIPRYSLIGEVRYHSNLTYFRSSKSENYKNPFISSIEIFNDFDSCVYDKKIDFKYSDYCVFKSSKEYEENITQKQKIFLEKLQYLIEKMHNYYLITKKTDINNIENFSKYFNLKEISFLINNTNFDLIHIDRGVDDYFLKYEKIIDKITTTNLTEMMKPRKEDDRLEVIDYVEFLNVVL